MVKRLESTKSVVGSSFNSKRFSFKNLSSKRSGVKTKSTINIVNAVSIESLALMFKYKDKSTKNQNVFKRLSTKNKQNDR